MITIVPRKVSELVPYEKNPRKISEEAINAVAESIQEFGFKNPILIDKNNVIIAGHTRRLASLKLGLERVPCVVVDDLTPQQIKALRLADNKTNELAEWDIGELDLELEGLLDMDMERFGFDIPDIAESGEATEDDFDEETAKIVPKVQRGEVWVLGNHRLMCGDTSNADDVQKLMGGAKAVMCFTDPPYGVAIGDKNKVLNSIQKAGRCTENIENDTLSQEELKVLLTKAMSNIKNSCTEDAVYFVTAPQGGGLGEMMMMMMKDAGLEVKHNLIWKKNSATFSLGRLDYDYQHEPIFYTWGKKHHNYRRSGNHTTIWEYDKPRKCDLHPTMKPVELVGATILDGSQEGEIVIDGFGGSGTTIVACEQLNRRGFLMELDPHYCDVIIARWENLTGEKAKKEDADV